MLKTKLKIYLSRMHQTNEAGFSSPPQLAESLSLVLLSVSLNASLIVFDFFQIISFRLPLLILKPPSLSLCLSLMALSFSLSHSLPLNAHTIDVFFPSPSWPLWCFPLFSSTLCLPPFICQRFSAVFSPQVDSLSCTQMYGYARGFTELYKAKTNTDFYSEAADGWYVNTKYLKKTQQFHW